jgi:3',5'-cyclic AMP phosphodiesterase CpdA
MFKYQLAKYTGNISSRKHIPSFILVGDTQRTSFWEFWREQNDSARFAVLQKIASENPAFVIHLGDFVYQGSSQNHWAKFDAYAYEFRNCAIPLFPVLGNHEFYGNKKNALHNYYSHFPYLKKRKWIAFRFCSVGFILLDSNFDKQRDNEKKQQDRWYRKRLREFQNDSALTTILVACHHPPYTNSTIVNDDEEVQSTFVKPFTTTPKTKLFFSGHCHSYEHFVLNNKHFIVSGGGGGPRHILKINANKQRHSDTSKNGARRAFHFCRISILSKGLRVQMFRLNSLSNEWSLGDEFDVG